MNKNSVILGIDISKEAFEVYDELNGHRRYGNDEKGFRSFHSALKNGSWAVMEAAVNYHQGLVLFPFERGIRVSMLNALFR